MTAVRHIPSNRKKVRGWKRQAARVRAWRDAHLQPDFAHLQTYGREYAKLHLDPWDRLVRRTPPAWLRREMIHALLDVHAAWDKVIWGRPDVAYLAIWLYWPLSNTQGPCNAGAIFLPHAQRALGLQAEENPRHPPTSMALASLSTLLDMVWLTKNA